MGCGSGRFFLVRSSLAGGLRAALVTPYPALVTLYPFLVTPYPALVTPGPALVAPDSAIVTPDLALAAQGPSIVTPGLVAYPFEFPVGGVFLWRLFRDFSGLSFAWRPFRCGDGLLVGIVMVGNRRSSRFLTDGVTRAEPGCLALWAVRPGWVLLRPGSTGAEGFGARCCQGRDAFGAGALTNFAGGVAEDGIKG